MLSSIVDLRSVIYLQRIAFSSSGTIMVEGVDQLTSFAGAFSCCYENSASFEERKAVSASLVQIQF